MKKILNDLSKLASEAAATGHTNLAKRIGSILKAAEGLTGLAEPDQASLPEGPAPAINALLKEKNKKEEIARGHEKAKTILLSIMKMYNEARKPPPFLIPSGTLSGQAILDILKMAGMGSKLTGWADLYERLETIKTKANEYLMDLGDNPFQASSSASSKSVAPVTEGLYPPNPATDRPQLSHPMGTSQSLVSVK
jgi:hypothetical protein